MERFYLNGIPWTVYYVSADCPYLVDRTGSKRLATTDIRLGEIYIYEGLSGELLRRVTVHEIGHAALASFGLLDDLSRYVKPQYLIEAEEWVCNLLADYSLDILQKSEAVLGNEIRIIPKVLDRAFL